MLFRATLLILISLAFCIAKTRFSYEGSCVGYFWCSQGGGFGKISGSSFFFFGRNKSAIFRYIEQRVRDMVSSWQKKLLTRVGKEVLLKSVAANHADLCYVYFPPASWGV